MTDESPADLMAPDPLPVAGLTLDMPRVQKTISRWVERRMWLIDRFNSIQKKRAAYLHETPRDFEDLVRVATEDDDDECA